MRITKTFDWQPGRSCPCGDDNCERFYCTDHRLLYRSCDTAEKVSELASWEDGGTKRWLEYTGTCPHCKSQAETKRYREWAEQREHQEQLVGKPNLAA